MGDPSGPGNLVVAGPSAQPEPGFSKGPPPFFPPPGNDFTHPPLLNSNEPADNSEQQGKCSRWLKRFAQQPETTVLLPLWWFRPNCQVGCALLAAVLFIAIGVGLWSTSGSIVEVAPITYLGTEKHKEFTLDTQIDGNVLVYYDLPGMLANRKYIVENKDPDITYTMMSRVKCLDAESQEAFWRRSCDPTAQGSPLVCSQDAPFADLFNAVGSTDTFKPCGLLALSTFIDTYRFEKHENGNWTPVSVHEDDIALPYESGINSKVYGSKIILENGVLTIKGARSWLTPGPLFEHFKVWYRAPASPHVRNLWGRIKGPLTAGKYRVLFASNSPIFTEQWGMKEKQVILTGEHSMGGKGACTTLGSVAFALGVVELLVAIGFCVTKLTVGNSM